MHSYRCRRPAAPRAGVVRPSHAALASRARARSPLLRRRWFLGLLLASSAPAFGATGAAADETRSSFAYAATLTTREYATDGRYRAHAATDSTARYGESERPGDDASPGTCQAVLPPRFAKRPLTYPGGGRLKLGSATITLSYTIDERGETEDDSVAVVYERSGAARPKYFDLFAAFARDTVKRYRYDFASGAGCSKRQQRTLAFEFKAG